MITALIVAGVVTSTIGLLAATGAYMKRENAETMARVKKRADAVGLDYAGGVCALTRGPHRAQMTSVAGNQSVPYWRITVEKLALAERTTLGLHIHGANSQVIFGIGPEDVEVGDAELDKKLLCTGSVPDMVRAVLSDGDVRLAVRKAFVVDPHEREPFGYGALFELRVTATGVLTAVATRQCDILDIHVGEAKEQLERILELAALLDRAARLPPRAALDEGGVGASSGAPVAGVRIV